MNQYQTRVIHNSLLVLFALNTLPPSLPSPEICTRATMWALPQVTSALYIAQFTEDEMSSAIARVNLLYYVKLKKYFLKIYIFISDGENFQFT